MKKSKFKTCKFNANRHASDIAYPYCTWNPNIQTPPHIYWTARYDVETFATSICPNCKCYEKDSEDENQLTLKF